MKATLRHGVQALLVLLAVLAPLSVQAERKLLDQVVAIVDEDVILQTELEARINTITSRLSAQGTALPPRQEFASICDAERANDGTWDSLTRIWDSRL